MRHRNRNRDHNQNNEEMELPCTKHPSSSVGICAYCLKDRLLTLVCSDCGEQRLSSCSCSDSISSNRLSCSVELGRTETFRRLEADDGVSAFLRRSNSSSAEIKRKGNGFSKLRRIFGKKKKEEKETVFDDDGDDRNMGVSRSRSLCSFRNGLFGSDDGARSSSVTACMFLDSGRRSGFSEVIEPRKSDIDTFSSSVSEFSGFVSNNNNTNGVGSRRVFSLKETDFGGLDDSAFIDLKLDFSSEMKPRFVSDSETRFGTEFGRSGSCRITVNDRGVKSGRKSMKGWRWIFRNQ